MMRTHSSLPHSAQHSDSYTTAQLATMPTGLSACHSSETDTDLCVGSEHCVTYFKCVLFQVCIMKMHSHEESDLFKVM